jgi:hypothetical protein
MSRNIRACIKQQLSSKAHENSGFWMRKEAVSDWKRELLEWHFRLLWQSYAGRKPNRPQSLWIGSTAWLPMADTGFSTEALDGKMPLSL